MSADPGRVGFCNWCPDPAHPSPIAHPGGQAAHRAPPALDGDDYRAEAVRLRAMLDALLEVGRLYLDAFAADEMLTVTERLALQRVQDIVADPAGWTPDREPGYTADRL